MLILSLNCANSSIKSALIESVAGRRLLEVRIENIGGADAVLRVGDENRSAQARNQAEPCRGG